MVTEVTFSQPITTREQLREVIAEPSELAVRKQISVIDEHCRAFIERAPFLFLATSDAQGKCDVSPKGDAPGFVQIVDENTIVIPDRIGNNRLDSIENIIENPHAAAIFIIPGAEWTLRVNGRATIIRDEDILERSAVNGKRPALGIAIDVEEAFLHCPKCMVRSNLWNHEGWTHKDDLSFAQIVRDQVKLGQVPVEVIEKAIEKDRAPESLY